MRKRHQLLLQKTLQLPLKRTTTTNNKTNMWNKKQTTNHKPYKVFLKQILGLFLLLLLVFPNRFFFFTKQPPPTKQDCTFAGVKQKKSSVHPTKNRSPSRKTAGKQTTWSSEHCCSLRLIWPSAWTWSVVVVVFFVSTTKKKRALCGLTSDKYIYTSEN